MPESMPTGSTPMGAASTVDLTPALTPVLTGVTCILNDGAGGGDADAAAAVFKRIAAARGIAVKVIVPAKGSDLGALARDAVRSGSRIVVAGGGDGTINAVASALVGTETALGVLPLGTLNHFAKDLGIPLEIEAAIETIFSGRIAAVDVGEVNGQVFLNNSSLGLYPRIVRQREAQQKRGLHKWIAFIGAVGFAAINHSSLHLRIKLDAEATHPRKTPFIFIGNNRYQIAGLEIGKRASLTGGRLWVCEAPDTGRFGLLRLTLRALSGRLKERDLAAVDASEVWVESRQALIDVALDGEVRRLPGRLHYRTRPGALRVILPAAAALEA